MRRYLARYTGATLYSRRGAGNELETKTDNSKNVKFDPARDGFGFRNPIDRTLDRTGGGRILRWFDTFVYGKDLCFGMAATLLLSFTREAKGIRPPLADLSPTPDLLAMLREYQLQQFRPRVVLATVWDWIISGGQSTSSNGLARWGRVRISTSSASGRRLTEGSFTASRGRTPSYRTGSRKGGCTSTTLIIRVTGSGLWRFYKE